MAFQHQNLILRWSILRNNKINWEHELWSETDLEYGIPYLTTHQPVLNTPRPRLLHSYVGDNTPQLSETK